MKTPISYYGGKQQMARHILPNIPKHSIYTEAFFGGGAIFWKKEPVDVEVINDLNGSVTNFYRELKENFAGLQLLVQGTLHSRKEYIDAKIMYENPHLFDKTRLAWAFWMLTQQGFLSKIGSWGYSKKKSSVTKKIQNKKINFIGDLATRLEKTQIECNDASKVILSRDDENTFHFIDPPYVGSNLGHYRGYNIEHYKNLLDSIVKLKGKFILSSYQSEILEEYTKDNGWYTLSFKKNLSASSKKGATKIEVMTSNYPIKRY